jgi:ferredoxin
MTPHLLLCNCEGTAPVPARDAGRQLCRAELGRIQAAAQDGGVLTIGCTQEAALFAETLPENELRFVNIRERALWSDEAAAAGPKVAALLAEAALEIAPTPSVPLKSEGTALVYGTDERAIEAGRRLKERLDVTVLLTGTQPVEPPLRAEVPVFKGRIVRAKGHLGAFEITIDGYAQPSPASRAALAFGPAQDGVQSRCDLILDLTGRTPLFPAPEKRDGYLRPDPGNPAAVERAIFDTADLVGEFEKPRYVAFDAALCAHSRSKKTGCTRCLDLCPTGAIVPAGDSVAIDPYACAGCGSCAAVCPTGAATYALPAPVGLFERLRTLLTVYADKGGTDPVLLVHDGRHGEALIAALARHGRGLPARVLPFAVNEVSQVGLDFLATAFGWGAARICLLIGPGAERDGIAQSIGLAETLLAGLGYGTGRVAVLDESDPDLVGAALREKTEAAPKAGSFLAMGNNRARTMLALRHLRDHAPERVDTIALAPGAPFGAVVIEQAGCTLCLACVGACPTGALADNPDKPMLRFAEEACVQCGLCRNTCPESVITLQPRLNFLAAGQVVLKEEEPAECVRCHKPFGSKSSIERIVAKLAAHPMFAAGALDRIRMCEDCRVIVQFEQQNPLAGAPRPVTRTTDDDLRERDDLRKRDGG